MSNSCNPCFTDIALSLGKDVMYSYLDAFGYGNTLGIDLAGEQSGLLVSKTSVTNGDLARIGFGQTVAVTPIQLAYATAAAVNGGKLMTPYLVNAIVDEIGNTVKKIILVKNLNRFQKKPAHCLPKCWRASSAKEAENLRI